VTVNEPLNKVILCRAAASRRWRGAAPLPEINAQGDRHHQRQGRVGKTNNRQPRLCPSASLGKKAHPDADLGLGNLDVAGVAPKFKHLPRHPRREKLGGDFEEGLAAMKILPPPPIQELTQLSHEQKMQVFTDLDRLIDDTDLLLIDTAADLLQCNGFQRDGP
jgi:hypothetical protein